MISKISTETHNGEPCIRIRVLDHEMLGHESNVFYVIGSCLVESHKIIFDFSDVQKANSTFIDSVVKIVKMDKKKHASFVLSAQLLKIISLTGLNKILKIVK
jgi:hypothetical protein